MALPPPGTSLDFTKLIPSDYTTLQLSAELQATFPHHNITTVATHTRPPYNSSGHHEDVDIKLNGILKQNSTQSTNKEKYPNYHQSTSHKNPPNPSNFYYNELYDDYNEDPKKYRNYSPPDGQLPDAIYWRKFAQIRRLYNASIRCVVRFMACFLVCGVVRCVVEAW